MYMYIYLYICIHGTTLMCRDACSQDCAMRASAILFTHACLHIQKSFQNIHTRKKAWLCVHGVDACVRSE